MRSLEETLLMAEITRVEVPAALWRKQRMGDLSPADARLLCAAFTADSSESGRFVSVAVASAVLGEASQLVARHPLRAYDAVQLATALAVRSAGIEAVFVCFDDQLNRAAAAEGLEILAT